MQNMGPLIIHPKISFSVHHVPSPMRSFLIATGPPPLWPGLWVRTKTSWIEWMMALVMCLRSDIYGACSIPIKPLTYTLIIHQVRFIIDGICRSIVPNVAKVCFNMWCSGRITILCLARLSAMSLKVYDAAQKYGGNSLHPIWKMSGMTIHVSLMSFSGVNLGRTYVKFHASSGSTLSCQLPSLMSYLEKYHGPVSI